MDFKSLLKKDYVILDGAMGTMLQSQGLEAGGIPELLSITEPEKIMNIHKSYIEAGSNIIYANTFGANRYKLKDNSVEKVVKASVNCAKKACRGTDTLTALDIGPIGQLLEPTGNLKFEEAYDIFREIILAGKDADVIVLETMTDLYEVKAGLLAAKENSDKPVIVTMTFEENMRTFTGCSIASMAITLEGLGADAIGVNCSLGPRELYPIIEEISKWTSLPIVVKPNAGLPDPVTNKYNVTPAEFAQYIAELNKFGIRLVGGCCGTNPDYISETVKVLQRLTPVIADKDIPSAICSSANTVTVNMPRIIGERINPTGKRLFKEALRNKDMDYILGQAIEQVQGGAEILDVNVGLPEIDEKEMMITAVKAIQGVVDVPLQIDTTIPDVLEAALRVYNGKPIVNSVNGEEESLDTVLPLVKKYGAAVVGLTLDKDGIPPKAEKRIEIAKKIMNRALAAGIPKRDIYIDCLTLTASAEQAAVMETLKAVEYVKNNLGLHTVLGVSNISFGLPNRTLINSTFLTMALTKGLDLPIINPNIEAMTGAVRAYRLLAGHDINSAEFIENYGNSAPVQTQSAHTEHTLEYTIEKGLKGEARAITSALLKTKTPMEVINEIIIPALDKAGNEFEKGRIFLPQLILSASVAQEAFEVLKAEIAKSDNSIDKGKIVIATVKGDVHDIGKNIVKVLLENYGYTVIDLGKDVEYETVVNAVKENNCRLVGLSALMTTTLGAMENTIKLIRENGLDCKVMVGGAVLTPDYAQSIGADYYSKDAKQSVDIAKKVLG